MSRRRRALKRSLLTLAAILLLTLLRGCIVRPTNNFPGSHFNRGKNAVWLGIEWVNEAHSMPEIQRLADDLKQHQIVYVYAYVSYLRANNVFGATYDHALDFVTALKRAAPDLKVLAWYGVPTGQNSLGSSNVRAAITAFSTLMVQTYGFDGVQIDAEPVADGDLDFVSLLQDTRGAIGPQAILSVAAPSIWPIFPDFWQYHSPSLPIWSRTYYQQVAQHVDQIAAMIYDSALPLPILYRVWSRFQVIQISKALSGANTELLIGIPTSEEETATHHAFAENMESGLQGAIDGLNDDETQPNTITGVAIYPYWETDSIEWAAYDVLWLGTHP